MSRPKHCHGHTTSLITPDVTELDRKLNRLREIGVPCLKAKCRALNFPWRHKCGKCRMRIKPSNTMVKAGVVFFFRNKWYSEEIYNKVKKDYYEKLAIKAEKHFNLCQEQLGKAAKRDSARRYSNRFKTK